MDTPAILAAVQALVQALTGIQHVQVGVPDTLPFQVSAYVTCGGQRTEHRTTGTTRTTARFVVTFGYDVSGAEEGAETTLAGLLDALRLAVYGHKTLAAYNQTAPGTALVKGTDLDLSGADSPDYAAVAGAEARLYPCVLTVYADESFNPTQP